MLTSKVGSRAERVKWAVCVGLQKVSTDQIRPLAPLPNPAVIIDEHARPLSVIHGGAQLTGHFFLTRSRRRHCQLTRPPQPHPTPWRHLFHHKLQLTRILEVLYCFGVIYTGGDTGPPRGQEWSMWNWWARVKSGQVFQPFTTSSNFSVQIAWVVRKKKTRWKLVL